MNASPRIAIEGSTPLLEEAVRRGGGRVVALGEPADGLVWAAGGPEQLRSRLEVAPSPGWVQLAAAGVDAFAAAGVFELDTRFTSAKGAYAFPVAEHAIALILALLRVLPERVRATTWGAQRGASLRGERVLVIGGGGIATSLLELLAPFETVNTVVRRSGAPIVGARVVTGAAFERELRRARVVVIAAALTDETRGLIGAAELAAMRSDAVLVNVARGAIVSTDALVEVLVAGGIAGAGLDVTDPEPLPPGHPLWTSPNTIITPHTADTVEMIAPLLAARVESNVRRFATGQALIGEVDPRLGY